MARRSAKLSQSSSAASSDELRALYTKIDRELEGWGCEASTDCCRFGVTGREPYPTAIELAELEAEAEQEGA